MLRTHLEAVIDDVLADRHLLTHPFYRRWEEGTLQAGELAAYAAQYRHFEAVLPRLLEEIASGLTDPGARQLVDANLADERGVPSPHIELFDEFVAAVGDEGDASPTPATEALVATYRTLVAQGPVAGLAALAAYESQAPAIARSKADGLYQRYGFADGDARFWEVHAEMDAVHATWALDAITAEAPDADVDAVRQAARMAADAWWAFLDDREAAAVAV